VDLRVLLRAQELGVKSASNEGPLGSVLLRRWHGLGLTELQATGCGPSRPHAGAHDRRHGRLALNLHRRRGLLDEDNAEIRPKAQTDPHLATVRQKHGQPPLATTGRNPEDLDSNGRMNPMLRTKKGREVVAKRKTVPESFSDPTKAGRGLRRFLLRGLQNVNSEWRLWSTTHNILMLFRV
jgi:hypothetical protein